VVNCANKDNTGLWEFCKKGDPPVMGITKLGDGVTTEDLLRPRRKLLLEETAARIGDTASSQANVAAQT
jgi:hypothetical protein